MGIRRPYSNARGSSNLTTFSRGFSGFSAGVQAGVCSVCLAVARDCADSPPQITAHFSSPEAILLPTSTISLVGILPPTGLSLALTASNRELLLADEEGCGSSNQVGR